MSTEHVIEYTPPRGPRRRVTYYETAGQWYRREEQWTGCSWNPVGNEPVGDVVID